MVDAVPEPQASPQEDPPDGGSPGDARQHYSAVVVIQGEVEQDQDWNEKTNPAGAAEVACDGSSKLAADEAGILESVSMTEVARPAPGLDGKGYDPEEHGAAEGIFVPLEPDGEPWKVEEGIAEPGIANLAPVLGRAVTDPEFRQELARNPKAALAGYGLSGHEHELLRQLDPDQMEAIARLSLTDGTGGEALGRLFGELLWGSGVRRDVMVPGAEGAPPPGDDGGSGLA